LNNQNITPETLAAIIAQATANAMAPMLQQQQQAFAELAKTTAANTQLAPSRPSGAPELIRDLFKKHYLVEGQLRRSAKDIKTRGNTICATVLEIDGVEQPLGKFPVGVMSRVVASLYREKRKSTGKTRYGTPPKTATLNREIALLKRVYSYATSEGWVTKNPLSKFGLEEEDNIRNVELPPEDFAHLLTFCDHKTAALAMAYYSTGCRRLEIQHLKWTGFDHETGQIFLLKTKTKGKKKREPVLSPEALKAILSMPRVAGSEYVFASPETKKPIASRFLLKLFQRAVRRSGLEEKRGHISWHTLRHQFVRNGRQDGLSEKVLMAAGGWATRSAFDRYGMPSDDEITDAFRRVHRRIGPKAIMRDGQAPVTSEDSSESEPVKKAG